jgi:hypothetical protein
VKLAGYLEVGVRAGRNHGGGATLQGYPTRDGCSGQMTIEIGDNRMTRVEYDGDNPLGLANEIDAALAKYGLGSDRRICKGDPLFLRANYVSSPHACAAPTRRRSQSSRPAAITKWPHGKKLRNTLSSLKGCRPPRDRY